MKKILHRILVFFVNIIKDCMYTIGIVSSILGIAVLLKKEYIDKIMEYKVYGIIVLCILSIIIVSKNVSSLVLTISIKLSSIDSKITIKYGNILKSKNNICLTSSNFFNLDLKIIKKENVLGKLIDKEFKNKMKSIDDELIKSLSGYKFKTVEPRHGGHTDSYEMGSLAFFTREIQKRAYRVYLLAITNIDDTKPQMTYDSKKEYIDIALSNLWIKLRNEANNEKLVMPIIGTGISKSMNSKYLSLLDICVSFINESKNKKIIDNLEILIYRNEISVNMFSILKKSNYSVTS